MLDSIAPPVESAMQAAECGTPATREPYSPGTVLADRHGREWTVTSYGTSAYVVGAMAPFEAMEIGRLDRLHGPIVVKAASLKHQDLFHRKPFPGCHNCPPAPCWCDKPECTDYTTCYRDHAGSETTWREAA